MPLLLNYTREPIDEFYYDPKLAYSMHLALGRDQKSFRPLNHNSGVLFVKATENPDGSLNPKSMKNPWLFALPDKSFGVAAVRTQGEGQDDEESRGCIVFFRSADLLTYEELGLWKLSETYLEKVRCETDETGELRIFWKEQDGGVYRMSLRAEDFLAQSADGGVRDLRGDKKERTEEGSVMWKTEISSGIEGAVEHNVIEISEEVADRLEKKLLTPVHTGTFFPERVEASSAEELGRYRADAHYSDGTSERKKVDFDLSGVDFEKKGSYRIRGMLHREHFDFPVARHRADPCVGRWNGKYYFIATNDADDNHTLYIREADTVSGLVNAKEHLLLDSTTYEGIGGLLWAPEFHEINGKLYIFHAATPGEFFFEESHVMELKEGGNPICREDWSRPRRVVKKDGSDLCEAGKVITLDMTVFCWQEEWYAVWSQRQFVPKDLGAWLYIARLDPKEPWRLLTEPVVLSKPDYGWANNHTFVDEGPFALLSEKKLYLTFSSAAVDTSYVVGLLSIERGKDPLDVQNWKKNNYPILTSRSVPGEFGTGHNAYVTDEDGVVWTTYHARPGIRAERSSGIRRVHFDVDGAPVLDMTEEMDVAEEFREVQTMVVVP